MTARPVSVLLVGDARRPEFAVAHAMLSQRALLAEAADVPAALDLLAAGPLEPEVIVFAQACPGQLSADGVERLRRRCPLARMVALLGSWCEGEARTGRPWPGVVRVYWHQWPARCALELERIGRGVPSAWTLPPTATDEERLLATAESPLATGKGLVAIHARQSAMVDWLSDACRQAGYATVRLAAPQWPRFHGATAAVFDATDLGPAETAELRRLVGRLRPAPVLAILDFPRPADRRRALDAGAAEVLSKPVFVEDLLWHLANLSQRQT